MNENRELTWERFSLMEDAINTIATIIGFTTTKLIKEKDKEIRDETKIKELDERLDKYYREQSEIYAGNDEVRRRVIDEYSPLIAEYMIVDRGERARQE